MGIDPGTRVVGYGIVDKAGSSMRPVVFGVVRPGTKGAFAERLREIFEGLTAVIDEFSPDVVATEEIFYHKSVPSAIKIGEGRGVAILSAALKGLSVHVYPSTKVKKSVTGNGRASKEQVQQMVKVILGLDEVPRPDDAADALAIAICHAHRV
jgi:crossover junction endodeoxyribonuclease RuvC